MLHANIRAVDKQGPRPPTRSARMHAFLRAWLQLGRRAPVLWLTEGSSSDTIQTGSQYRSTDSATSSTAGGGPCVNSPRKTLIIGVAWQSLL
mmetsp:Transcript_89004/g.236415  ORF Transcript_89004/g.236415 Transcript_89004/m.236415 type:complete len:92 (-) Transcript_89004:15-290(-)